MALSGLQIATLSYTLITAYIFAVIGYRRVREGIKALDYLLVIFALIILSGTFQFLDPIFEGSLLLFSVYISNVTPLAYDPVRNLGVLTFLAIYVFAEYTLAERLSKFRVSIIVSAVTVYFIVFLVYLTSGRMILMSDVLPVLQDTRLDEFAYDVIVFIAITLLDYSFIKQYRVVDIKEVERDLLYLVIGFSIFCILYVVEIMEHFLPIPDINFIFFTLPVFLVLGVIYLKNPRFIYSNTSDIHFMQVATSDGHLIMVSELRREGDVIEYLTPVSLSSINSLFMEMIGRNQQETFQLNSIQFDQGSIFFETKDDLFVIVYVEQPTKILRSSIAYFIDQFNLEFADDIHHFSGGVMFEGRLDIEPLLRKCIPILQSKKFVSRINPDVPGGVN
ncbi:MAG: hypothetical protein ACXAE3_09290 [Candidatus Kariarchaeaceae archaeon]|jgi:hypothetical protein